MSCYKILHIIWCAPNAHCEHTVHWLSHLDRNSIFAHLNSRMSLLDYSSQRSKVMAALSLASFPSSWWLVHMRLLLELSESAAF